MMWRSTKLWNYEIVYCATRKKNVFCECEVWFPSKARATTTRLNLMFFPCRTQFFFLLGGQKMDLFIPHGEIKSTFWPASRKTYKLQGNQYRWNTKLIGWKFFKQNIGNLKKNIGMLNFLLW